MPELIDRYATMDAIPAPTDADEAEYYGKICDVIETIPAVNRWIPCSERLPEVYEKVLTYSDEGIIHDNFRLNLRDGSIGWSQGWGVTHWRPRPDPPEGGAGNG